MPGTPIPIYDLIRDYAGESEADPYGPFDPRSVRLGNLGKFSADYSVPQLTRLISKSREVGISPLTTLAHAMAEGYIARKPTYQGEKGWIGDYRTSAGISPDWTSMFDPGFLTHLNKEGVIKLTRNPYSFNWKDDPMNSLREVLGQERQMPFPKGTTFNENIDMENWLKLDPELLAIHRLKYLGEKFKNRPEVIRQQAWQGLGKVGITEGRGDIKRYFGKAPTGESMRKRPEHGKRVVDLIRRLSESPELKALLGE